MILGNNQIRVLDPSHQQVKELSIESIIPSFHIPASYVYNKLDNGLLEVLHADISKMYENKLMVPDLDGWTELISISKIKLPEFSVNYFINQDVIVTESELIPVYNHEDSKIGFQGNCRYHYNLKEINHSINKAEMRLRRYDFREVKIYPLYAVQAEYGYMMETLSGFYSIGKTMLNMYARKNKQENGYK